MVCRQFQSTRPRGTRPLFIVAKRQYQWFQSTRPRGTRHSNHSSKRCYKSFNPRVHEERDYFYWRSPFTRQSFNPRVHEERDSLDFLNTDDRAVSIHASTRNATRTLGSACAVFNGFNPRVHEERDYFYWRSPFTRQSFNPRVHEERDVGSQADQKKFIGFQSTRPRGTRLLL